MRSLWLIPIFALSGCEALWGGYRQPGDRDMTAGPPDLNAPVFTQLIDDRTISGLDVLFMIDNSPSMSPKQLALAQNIPKFIQAIGALDLSYHIGITTSDIGSWSAPGTPWGEPLGTCNSYEGDDGALQALPCTQRSFIDPNDPAKPACAMLCPAGNDRFVPKDGARFISVTDGLSNITVPSGTGASQLQAVQNAFQCLALVGDQGCGVEGQLEGARRALDGHNALNAAFLRDSSVLAVVFITDEDDCSIRLAQRAQGDPMTTDCETPDQGAAWSCFNPDYRCLAVDVRCAEPNNQVGLHTSCAERADTYLEDVNQRYVSFFSKLRAPNRLVLAGIWTTPSVAQGGKFLVTQTSMTNASDGLNRDTGAGAGCVYTGTDPNSQGVFGRPQLRLSKLAAAFPGTPEVSVCDTDHYPDALSTIAHKIQNKLATTYCLSQMPLLHRGQPVCTVAEVDPQDPGGAPRRVLPACSNTCCTGWATSPSPTLTDPNVMAACGGETADCYCAVQNVHGGICAGGVVAGIWRLSGVAPQGQVVRYACQAG